MSTKMSYELITSPDVCLSIRNKKCKISTDIKLKSVNDAKDLIDFIVKLELR